MWLVLDIVSLTSFIGIINVIHHTKTVQANMALESLRYQQSYYKELEQNQQNIRRLRHDMKNHLNIIGTFLKNNEIDNAMQYFKDLNQEFASNLQVYCPNGIVNATLNNKKQLASDSNIQCDFQIDLAKSPPIEDVDLCSILGNTLDNAIEALQKVPKISNRTLSLKVRYTGVFFSYEIKNTKANEIIIDNGKFITDKTDKKAHGIGLRNVRNIVKKYDGEIDISYTKDTFTVTIMIQG